MPTARTPAARSLKRALYLLAPCAAFLALAARAIGSPAHEAPPALVTLPAAQAVGIRVDTLALGGYARGSFTEALRTLASELSGEERALVGQHLDKIFADVLEADGLGRVGRLRVAYERTLRPDGSTRSIRVLTAEAAVAGALHTAYYYERDGKPGYFDPFGRSLDERSWAEPLMTLGMRITSPFGKRRMHPILRRVLPHTGVDYAAVAGSPVRATADGVVLAAGRRGGYGNLVEIQHPNGYSTRYAHLSRIEPGVGRARLVRQGEVIGYVGMTGLATGPHLHYEVRRDGRPVDPVRVTSLGLVTAEIGPDEGWPAQRQRLTRLLARTPTMARRGDPSTRG